MPMTAYASFTTIGTSPSKAKRMSVNFRLVSMLCPREIQRCGRQSMGNLSVDVAPGGGLNSKIESSRLAFDCQFESTTVNCGCSFIVFVVMTYLSGKGSGPSAIQICQSTSS